MRSSRPCRMLPGYIYVPAETPLLRTARERGLNAANGSEIATAASIDNRSVIGAGCTIKPNAQIINSVIGAGVHVEEKATVENSVIWAHTRISSFAEIRGSVIARGCHIGRNARVGEGTVLGDKASIPDYSRI